MNILLIGGTGNLSTDCAALLQQRGHKLYLISRGRSVVPAAYTGLIVDRHDSAAMSRLLQGLTIDVVLNFLGFNLSDVETDFSVLAGKIRQYLFISSATVYRKPHHLLPITETTPTGNPYSEYAQNKLACEEWLMERYRHEHFPVTIVRPSHTYSCRWVPNMVSSGDYTFVHRLEQDLPVFVHDDGQSLWTLTAASDFAVGLAGLIGRDQAIGEIFHITSDQVLTWNQIYAEICRAARISRPRILHIPLDFICTVAPELTAKLKGDKAEPGIFDNAKIKNLVPDFECRKTFRQGIAESLAWFRQHPQQRQPNPDVNGLFDKVTQAWQIAMPVPDQNP